MPHAKSTEVAVTTTKDPTALHIDFGRRIRTGPGTNVFGTSFDPEWLGQLNAAEIGKDVTAFVRALAEIDGIDAVAVRLNNLSLFRDPLHEWEQVFPKVKQAIEKSFHIKDLKVLFRDPVHPHIPQALVLSVA